MGNAFLLLHAFLWSILLGAMVDPRRLALRGRGPPQVAPLKILGFTAVLGALMSALEPPGIQTPSQVIRGGSAQSDCPVKRENPAFRLRRHDGSKARVLYETLKSEYKSRGPFKVKQKGEEKEMIGAQIAEMVNKWFEGWEMEVTRSDTVPITPTFVARMLDIRKEIVEKKARIGRWGTLDMYPGEDDLYLKVLTETGNTIEVPVDEILDWTYAQYLSRSNVMAFDANGEQKMMTLDQLGEWVDEKMAKEKVEVFNEPEDKYEACNLAGLKKLLDFEAPLQVNWEARWFMVTDDFFKFMELRFEQAKAKDPNPKPTPPSLREYAAPQGFDPLEMNDDGLLLVTPRMKEIEASRPVFGFSYYHVRGYCAQGMSPGGIPCEEIVRSRQQSFSARGLHEIEQEKDEIRFDNPEMGMLPPALDASYAGNPAMTAAKEAMERFYVPLIEGDMTYLTSNYIVRGKFLQQYAELRTFLSWMQKSVAVAEKLDFDNVMKSFARDIDMPGTDQTIMRNMISDHLQRNGLKRPMLSCREAVGMGPKRTLIGVTICLNRAYKVVDCETDGNCDSSFHWVTPPQ